MTGKALVLAPYVSIASDPAFARNLTGFGRSVWSVCESTARHGWSVRLFTYAFTRERTLQGVQVAHHSPNQYLLLPRLKTLDDAVAFTRRGKGSLKRKVKLAVASLTQEIIISMAQRIQPDIIHVHGATMETAPLVLGAMKSGFPVLVTLHGLNSFDSLIRLSDEDRLFEPMFIRFLNSSGVWMSAVSSGVRTKAITRFHVEDPDRFRVVGNGVNLDRFSVSESRSVLKRKAGLTPETHVLLSVGSLSALKNHRLLLEAILRLPADELERTVVLIAGEGRERESLANFAGKSGLAGRVRLLGRIEGSELADLYAAADLLVLPSTSEGFGMPVLEAMAAGTPTLSFADLDAMADLFSPGGMTLIRERTPEALAGGIREALLREWDSQAIKNHSQRFSWDSVATQYEALYANVSDDYGGYARTILRNVWSDRQA